MLQSTVEEFMCFFISFCRLIENAYKIMGGMRLIGKRPDSKAFFAS
jgi:hypothetical protein